MPRGPSLVPREHGAYAQLGFPLATGLVLGGITVAGTAFALASILLFLAHEPMQVMLGARGARRLSQQGPHAKRLLAGLLGTTLLVLAVFGQAGTRATLLAALPAAGLAAGVVMSMLRRVHRTTLGECLVAVALAATVMPVVVAGNVGVGTALLLWLTWAVLFVLATLAVRGVVFEHKARGGAQDEVVWEGRAARWLGAAAAGLAVLAWLAGRLPGSVAMALLIAGTSTTAVSSLRLHPTRLRQLGWTLVGVHGLTFLILVLGGCRS